MCDDDDNGTDKPELLHGGGGDGRGLSLEGLGGDGRGDGRGDGSERWSWWAGGLSSKSVNVSIKSGAWRRENSLLVAGAAGLWQQSPF